jgi:beta-phosphoglucomutase
MKKPKVILFDFDGTLADTMEDNFIAWKNAFSDYGINIKREDYFPLEGMKLIEVAKEISRKYEKNIIPDSIVEFKNNYYLENHSFRLYPGVQELIEKMKNKKRLIAIVSASPRKKLEKTVPEEFLRKFDAIVSGDDVNKGKPDPEPYLIAMKKLNATPKDCIVIENAPLGIKSAKSAGIYCVAITTTLEEKYLVEADRIVKNFYELKDIIKF